LAKLLRIMQEIGKKYKNIRLEKFRLSIQFDIHYTLYILYMYIFHARFLFISNWV
jgi:hypothetical protein